jgi:uncharacterized protein (TIGR02444 family)
MTEQLPNSPSDTPFWRFSLHFYRQAGVADACIALQDDCGVDVNLLLFLLWLAAGGRQLSATNVQELDDAVRGWRTLTIVPIRDVRRQLKGAPTLVESGKQEAFRSIGRADPVRAATRLFHPWRRGRILPPMSACSARASQNRRWTAS